MRAMVPGAAVVAAAARPGEEEEEEGVWGRRGWVGAGGSCRSFYRQNKQDGGIFQFFRGFVGEGGVAWPTGVGLGGVDQKRGWGD